MPAGQRFWDGQRTRGGWVRGDSVLRTALVEAGLPAKAPSTGAGMSAGAWAGIGSGSALAVLAFGSFFARRKPRGR
jgi:LPXTG-motif cell wall-anchored protein